METDKTNEIQNVSRLADNSRELTNDYRNLRVRPWIRFFARYIDLYILSIVLQIIVLLIDPQLLIAFGDSSAFLVLFLWIFVEPIFLATWGTTLGKYLLNTSVRNFDNSKLKFKAALSRSFWVWIIGFGLGLPLISFFTLYYSYTQLQYTGTTSWDKNNFTVTHGKIGTIKGTIASILIVVSLLFAILGIIAKLNST